MSLPDSDDEKPLDPAVLRVQRRLRRLILIAGLTLGLGLVAVFAAILYRVGSLGAPPPPTGPVVGTAATIPAGARLMSMTASGDRIVLAYEKDGATILVAVDPRSLAVTGRLDIKPE